MTLPGRTHSSTAYRYGFQGQEKDDELKGEGNSLNYTFRMHDPRVGRFFAVDPLTPKYPHYTPYSFSGNRVINARELEGLEEKIVYEQYLGKKVYKTELKRSHFTYVEWKVQQKYWWNAIIVYGKNNTPDSFQSGFEDYYYAVYNKPKLAYNKETNRWDGNEWGTLYVTDYHGTMYYSFDKAKAGTDSYKISVETLNFIDDWTENVEIGAAGVTVASGGTASVVTIPIIELTEAIGKIANIEKVVIQALNGDIKDAIGTVSKEFVVPAGVSKLFKKWSDKVPSQRGKERIGWLESIVQKAINEGLDSVDIPLDNKPTTTVRDNN